MAGDNSHAVSVQTLPPLPSAHLQPRSDPLLVICHCFSFVTAAIAVLCVVVNGFSAFRSFNKGYDIFSGIFRCYGVLLALFVAVAETEWSIIIKFWKVLDSWIGRGMLQIFVAVMTRAFPDVDGKRKDLVFAHELASYLLLACGFTYVVSGILCIHVLKRSRERKDITREQATRDLMDLEHRRQELEALLVADTA